MTRKSFNIESYIHATPIPAVSKVGPMLWSSPISPYLPGTRDIPANLNEQFEHLFSHMGEMLKAAGGTWEDVGKVDFFVAEVGDTAFKEALERHWLKHFPDEHSRPARHTIHVAKLLPNRKVMATFMAYIA